MSEQLKNALDLLDQCATALARTGGMMNRDLAHDVTKFTSSQRVAERAEDKPVV